MHKTPHHFKAKSPSVHSAIRKTIQRTLNFLTEEREFASDTATGSGAKRHGNALPGFRDEFKSHRMNEAGFWFILLAFYCFFEQCRATGVAGMEKAVGRMGTKEKGEKQLTR